MWCPYCGSDQINECGWKAKILGFSYYCRSCCRLLIGEKKPRKITTQEAYGVILGTVQTLSLQTLRRSE